MFDFVHKRKRFIQVILGLLIIPFALWGVESYQSFFGHGNDVAEVAGYRISGAELQRAMQQQQDRLRQAAGRNVDPALLDTPSARRELLDGMIAQRVLAVYAAKSNLVTTDEQLRDIIGAVPAFQDNGKFSRERYELLLKAQNSVPAQYEAQLRNDMVMQQLVSGLAESSFVARTTAQRLAALRGEMREVAEALIPATRFSAQVKLSPEAIEAFYKSTPKAFEIPEQVRVEYVELTQDALAADAPVSPEEVRAYYEAAVAPKYKERAAAKKKADELAALLRREPARFEELAKKESQDTGSAPNGGDLGWFSRGSMVKPFEDAVFRQKEKEIAGPIESEFGFHIVKVTGVRKSGKGEERRASHILLNAPQGVKDFEASRLDIERELRRQKLAKKFPESADAFSNLAYEQPDSLEPLAERFKLKIATTGWFAKNTAPPPLDNAKLSAALFNDETIKSKRNTEAFEVAPGRIVVARVIEHRPATLRPLADVKGEIIELLKQREAAAMARKFGEEKLAELRAGKDAALLWGPTKRVTRENTAGLNPPAVGPVFRADSSKLPAYVGLEVPSGYALYRISKVQVATSPDDSQLKATEYGLARQAAREDYLAFVQGLRARTAVEIHEDNLAKKGN